MKEKRSFFVSGIDTGIGKTICSAVLAEYLKADYWKPIQAGDLDNSDSITVGKLISNEKSRVHPEKFKLNTQASPHYAASIDNLKISLNDFSLPNTNNNLIVEGAGGLLVPINEKETIIDLIKFFDIPVILISKNYLGSINHTLLSIEVLKIKKIDIAGIIFNGEENKETQRIIEKLTKVKILGFIPNIKKINKNSIKELTKNIINL